MGTNSDAFDICLMQYMLERHLADEDKDGKIKWFDILTQIGVLGTIDTTRLVPWLKIIDGLT